LAAYGQIGGRDEVGLWVIVKHFITEKNAFAAFCDNAKKRVIEGRGEFCDHVRPRERQSRNQRRGKVVATMTDKKCGQFIHLRSKDPRHLWADVN
jgi:hypothetical protein